jgi:hypothetical protein
MTDNIKLLQSMMTLKSWDIPLLRRDISKSSNVRWLLRNLAANNRDDSLFPEAIRLLKTLNKPSKDK